MSAPGLSASYTYNHNHQRITELVGGGVTYALWDELSPYGDVILETDALNAPVASYVLGGAQILSQTKNGITSTLLPDAQGSTRLLTNASGAVIAAQAFEYSAFGDLLSASTPETRYLYTGQQYDSATDLYSLRARYYDPGVGRFVSRDTWAVDFANPVELNRYVYAMGNPVNWADPSGYSSIVGWGIKVVTSFWPKNAMGAMLGGAVGAVMGGYNSYWMYQAAKSGSCGDKLQAWACQIDLDRFVLASTWIGAITGAYLGSLGPSVGLSLSAVMNGGSAGWAIADMISQGRVNSCNLAVLVSAFASGALSSISISGPGGPSMSLQTVGGSQLVNALGTQIDVITDLSATGLLLLFSNDGNTNSNNVEADQTPRDVGDKPDWVSNGGSFVNWMKQLHAAFRESGFIPSTEQMHKIIQNAISYKIKMEYNPGHGPNQAPWTIPHLHFGDGRAHVPLPHNFPLQPNYTPHVTFPYGYP